MKLLQCLECRDIVVLRLNRRRECECRKSGGEYVDMLQVQYTGPARILGMLNTEMKLSLNEFKERYEENYRWFVIREGCNIEKLDLDHRRS